MLRSIPRYSAVDSTSTAAISRESRSKKGPYLVKVVLINSTNCSRRADKTLHMQERLRGWRSWGKRAGGAGEAIKIKTPSLDTQRLVFLGCDQFILKHYAFLSCTQAHFVCSKWKSGIKLIIRLVYPQTPHPPLFSVHMEPARNWAYCFMLEGKIWSLRQRSGNPLSHVCLQSPI